MFILCRVMTCLFRQAFMDQRALESSALSKSLACESRQFDSGSRAGPCLNQGIFQGVAQAKLGRNR